MAGSVVLSLVVVIPLLGVKTRCADKSTAEHYEHTYIHAAGELSDPINIKQGVRQGGVLSTGHYKRYNNPLLLQLEEGYSGIKIGSISIPHVTVADDLAILAGSKS